jgi:hypothetical protein
MMIAESPNDQGYYALTAALTQHFICKYDKWMLPVIKVAAAATSL